MQTGQDIEAPLVVEYEASEARFPGEADLGHIEADPVGQRGHLGRL
jgi:hypothetical protein